MHFSYRYWPLLVTLLFAAVGLTGASFVAAHSAMFPDQFRYDDTDEGRLPGASAKARSTFLIQENCVNGLAGDYPCRNIDFQSMLTLSQLGGAGGNANDIWGWTDLATGVEVAIVGKADGTAFVDISNPVSPQLLGFLPSHNGGSDSWRDIKVYQDHAFIVADGGGNSSHGLQVFDLTTLAGVTPGGTLNETAHLGGFGAAHNIAINEETGFAYVVGATQCSGGLYMVDISMPTQPQFAGCYSADGYTHDAQCVVYQGPDTQFFDQEICVAFNEDTLTVVDVSNKSNPQQLSRTTYPGVQYTHQGWFLDGDHSYLIMNDELDEQNGNTLTTSFMWDMRSLTAPAESGRFFNTTSAIDHNLYTRDGYVYQANYRSGLRILDASDVSQGSMQEVAFFDTIPCSDAARFSGAWSSYVDFASGNVIVSDIGTGLFVLRPNAAAISTAANAGPPATSPICTGPTETPATIGNVDPNAPVDPIEPADPVDPVDPTDPTDPADPVDPVDPADPTDPTDPTDPADPADPADPVDPAAPGGNGGGTNTPASAPPSSSGGGGGSIPLMVLTLLAVARLKFLMPGRILPSGPGLLRHNKARHAG